jgi:hypothetical protein
MTVPNRLRFYFLGLLTMAALIGSSCIQSASLLPGGARLAAELASPRGAERR